MGSYKPVKNIDVDMKTKKRAHIKNKRMNGKRHWIKKRKEELKDKAQAHNLDKIINVDEKGKFITYNKLKDIERRCSQW